MRRVLTTGLIGLATALLVAGMVAVWADNLLLSPSHWETASTRLLADPTIRTSTATYLADEIIARLHLSPLLGSGPASVLGPLGGLSVIAVRGVIVHAVDAALGLSPVRTLWAHANRAVATGVVAVVDGRRGPVSLNGGAVSINLKPILRAAVNDAHLPTAVTAALPPDAARLTIVRSDRVATVQTAGRAIHDLARWLPIIIPLLWFTALALSRGRRWQTLAWIGISAAVAAGLVLGARALMVTPVAHALSADASLQRIIAAALTIVTDSLGHLAIGVGIVGLVVGVIAGLAGRSAGGPRVLLHPPPRTLAGR